MSDDVQRIGTKIRQAVKLLVQHAIARVAIRASGNMVVPGGRGNPVDPEKLTTRSGRLLRSILGARTASVRSAFTGSEGFRTILQRGDQIVATVGTSVPYAAVHEHGHAAFSVIPTSKQRRFFWAKFYETQDSKWRGMALARGLTRRAYGGRPFLAPAAREVQDEMPELMNRVVREVFG